MRPTPRARSGPAPAGGTWTVVLMLDLLRKLWVLLTINERWHLLGLGLMVVGSLVMIKMVKFEI